MQAFACRMMALSSCITMHDPTLLAKLNICCKCSSGKFGATSARHTVQIRHPVTISFFRIWRTTYLEQGYLQTAMWKKLSLAQWEEIWFLKRWMLQVAWIDLVFMRKNDQQVRLSIAFYTLLMNNSYIPYNLF